MDHLDVGLVGFLMAPDAQGSIEKLAEAQEDCDLGEVAVEHKVAVGQAPTPIDASRGPGIATLEQLEWRVRE